VVNEQKETLINIKGTHGVAIQSKSRYAAAMVKNPKGGKHLQEEFVWIEVMFPHQIFLISYLGIIREERLEIWQPQINEKAGWKKRKKKRKKRENVQT